MRKFLNRVVLGGSLGFFVGYIWWIREWKRFKYGNQSRGDEIRTQYESAPLEQSPTNEPEMVREVPKVEIQVREVVKYITKIEERVVERRQSCATDNLCDCCRQTESIFPPVQIRDDFLDKILRKITESQKSIRLCMHRLTHPAYTEALLFAHERKVKLSIITDIAEMNVYHNREIEKLLSNAVEIRRLKNLKQTRPIDPKYKPRNVIMHCKFAIIDDEFLICGSMNWTDGGMMDNTEHLNIFRSTGLINQFKSRFDELWSEFCVPLRSCEYKWFSQGWSLKARII